MGTQSRHFRALNVEDDFSFEILSSLLPPEINTAVRRTTIAPRRSRAVPKPDARSLFAHGVSRENSTDTSDTRSRGLFGVSLAKWEAPWERTDRRIAFEDEGTGEKPEPGGPPLSPRESDRLNPGFAILPRRPGLNPPHDGLVCFTPGEPKETDCARARDKEACTARPQCDTEAPGSQQTSQTSGDYILVDRLFGATPLNASPSGRSELTSDF